jgi:hypothetical protein
MTKEQIAKFKMFYEELYYTCFREQNVQDALSVLKAAEQFEQEYDPNNVVKITYNEKNEMVMA